ncbi:hypothetical protein LCGC14_0220830 [marine sediment metagenome]|uniref:Uncharacterized protein n=1 Tax=marine sediment metagenome TaxID=412755 RepID=A0A0F9UDF0_9ZZZZ
MTKKFVTLTLGAFMMIGIMGCTITTAGEASWEMYGGFRTRQHSDIPAKVTIQSSVVDKIVDSLTDGEVSEEE